MKALHKQLSFELERFETKPQSIETVFIGGGTPSTVSPALYAPIFDLFRPFLKDHAEITSEANPNSASKSWLKGMRDLGVNRLSFGVQSFDEAKLKALNRAHSPSQAKEAINIAHDLGFAHISLDLIYNYQGDTQTLLQSDIDQAFALPIDHISAYELTIEANTPFASTPQSRQDNEDLAFFVSDEIQKQGFKAYEISNFGTYQSKHNKGYWQIKNYIGAGAGAVGFLKDTRFYPQENIDAYIKNPLQIRTELLSTEELLTEKLFLGLRSNIGIAKNALCSKMQKQASLLVKEKKLLEKNAYFYNPNYFISDELALFILD
jgi:oxygen-independent coproporphyrinogen-3 oxidase